MVSKLDEWKLNINTHQPTVALITESWLNCKIPDSLISIPGYNLFRSDRENHLGGGVLILVKREISGHHVRVTIPTSLHTTEPIDSLWLNVHVGNIGFLVACVYRPGYSPREVSQQLIATLDGVFSKDHLVFVFGDFNYPEIIWKDLTLKI